MRVPIILAVRYLSYQTRFKPAWHSGTMFYMCTETRIYQIYTDVSEIKHMVVFVM